MPHSESKNKCANRTPSRRHDGRALKNLLAELKRHGLTITKPRKAIFSAMLREDRPVTAEEIHTIITNKVCDIATVYRSLTKLERAKIIRRLVLGDEYSRYKLSERNDNDHHHLICSGCKHVETVKDPKIKINDLGLRKTGYSNISHNLVFFGICPECKNK